MEDSEGSISYGIVTNIIGILLILRFVFYLMVIGHFEGSIMKFNITYDAMVYTNFHGSIDILMGIFSFVAGGVLMAERGGAGGLFLVVWIYSLWTSAIDLISLFTIASYLPTITTVILLDIIMIVIGAVILLVASARAE